jgi:hypothetical protein
MKLDQLLPSKYLKTSDLADGDRVVTVRELKKTNVARQDEAPEYKFVIFFDEFEKGLVLNATNIKRLGKYLGDDTDDWPGHQVTLYVDDNVQYGSDIVSGLRIKQAAKKAVGGIKPRQPSVEDINRDLAAAADDDQPPF